MQMCHVRQSLSPDFYINHRKHTKTAGGVFGVWDNWVIVRFGCIISGFSVLAPWSR